MSDRMTSITLPGVFGAGYADYGRKTVAEMLALVREYARGEKAKAEALLVAADDDFRVATYIGVHRQRDFTVIQEGRAREQGAVVERAEQVRPSAGANP